jgi:hypothetical protein
MDLVVGEVDAHIIPSGSEPSMISHPPNGASSRPLDASIPGRNAGPNLGNPSSCPAHNNAERVNASTDPGNTSLGTSGPSSLRNAAAPAAIQPPRANTNYPPLNF